jgi:hypothetical protein
MMLHLETGVVCEAGYPAGHLKNMSGDEVLAPVHP